ncbi:hypothetical protein RHSIM_RhsimUnG0106700 [Rhododendron simsii]|uniref:Uncharacterized protein n=1 Tax=Rhododendron simsii TaxID=118357 RepID=A0A834FVS6_RHOSS|nr:hypothetical protein RHSIM_RhsimUnG0106700 [Rhododendron simsii]
MALCSGIGLVGISATDWFGGADGIEVFGVGPGDVCGGMGLTVGLYEGDGAVVLLMEMEAKGEQRENEVIPSSDESRSVGDDHHLVLSGVWIGLISQWIYVSLVRDGYLLRVSMKDGSARAQKAWFGVTKV